VTGYWLVLQMSIQVAIIQCIAVGCENNNQIQFDNNFVVGPSVI